VSKSKQGVAMAAASVLIMAAAVLAILSWIAGGPQPLRQIAEPVAVPEYKPEAGQ
jgi:hypothetical protein